MAAGGHRSSTQSAARDEGRHKRHFPEISEPLRGEVKRLELDAERVMQSALASLAPSVVGPGSPAYAREALEAYLHHCGIAVTGDVSKLVDLLTVGMSEIRLKPDSRKIFCNRWVTA